MRSTSARSSGWADAELPNRRRWSTRVHPETRSLPTRRECPRQSPRLESARRAFAPAPGSTADRPVPAPGPPARHHTPPRPRTPRRHPAHNASHHDATPVPDRSPGAQVLNGDHDIDGSAVAA